jgi:hypothetical protein
MVSMPAIHALPGGLFKQTTPVYAKPRGFTTTQRIIPATNALRIAMRAMHQGAPAVLPVSILILKAAVPRSVCRLRRTLVGNA